MHSPRKPSRTVSRRPQLSSSSPHAQANTPSAHQTSSTPSHAKGPPSRWSSLAAYSTTPANGSPCAISRARLKSRCVWARTLINYVTKDNQKPAIRCYLFSGLHMRLGSCPCYRERTAISARLGCRLGGVVYVQVPECRAGGYRWAIRA